MKCVKMSVLVWQRTTGVGVIVLACFSTIVLSAAPPSKVKCKLSEYQCENGRCVLLTRFCNNVNDCGDNSDEPRYCTPCNRTYYGEVGKTYYLELHRPKEEKIPLICQLNFTAAGGEYGDLVQLTFDSFTLGRFVSFTTDGCPDGALHISESNRPQVGGSWCGTSWGPAIYYSETKSVTVGVSLLRLSKDQNGYNFDFRMEYKLLRKVSATVRYGGGRLASDANTTVPTIPARAEPEFYLGDLITGTYCSRIFSDCDRKRCRLQSPNFPGIYPRNLTCYYAVRQHEVPAGKHALITVKQPKGQLISIRSQSALYGTASTRELKVWNACDDVQDYVTVYDGYTTRDPVILKFCGGGEAVPEAVSSGHELLVEFSTSPYGTFLHPTPAQSLHGFQLEVEVKFVDQQTPTFVKSKRNCEFWIRGTTKGVLESPLHSLPANTTCLYHLQGMDTSVSPSPVPFRPLNPRYQDGLWRHTAIVFPPPRYRVWLSVVKFHVGGSRDPQKLDQEICKSYLNVWDGQLWTGTNCNDLYCTGKDKLKAVVRPGVSTSLGTSKNVTLLARYCKDHVPRSCDHALLANGTRFPRPCSLAESFLSSGDSITLELRLSDSSALRPVKFRALYEFVDLHLDGEPYIGGPCNRKFTITQDAQQNFQAPRDIFLYGRGGARKITCIYRFEAQKDEKVKIVLTQMVIKGRQCKTRLDPNTDRLQCFGNTTATLRIYEVPWGDVPPVPRDCFCGGDGGSHLPFTYVSTSNVVELRFDVSSMNATDDFNNLFFGGVWKFIKTPSCSKNLRMKGPSGEVALHYPSDSPGEVNCENYPRVITPSPNKYLYVKVNGIIMKQFNKFGNKTSVKQVHCGTSNKIIIHTALYSAIICPYTSSSRHNLVEIFSEGWSISSENGHRTLPVDKIAIDHLGKELSRSIVVDFIGKDAGSYAVNWLEISRRKETPPNGLNLLMQKPDECVYRCPELDACINSTVWCDGTEDCPSGIDEALTHCSIILQLPPLYLFIGSLILISCSLATCAVIWKTCRRRPRSFLQTRLKSLSSDTAIIDEKGVIC